MNMSEHELVIETRDRVGWELSRQTPWKPITSSSGEKTRIRITYGWSYIQGNRAPHFHVQYEERDATEIIGCGLASRELIEEHFPELLKLVRWHLCDTMEPMHYQANAQYWWELHAGRSDYHNEHGPVPLEAFKNTIVFDALASDQHMMVGLHAVEKEASAYLSLKRKLEATKNRLEAEMEERDRLRSEVATAEAQVEATLRHRDELCAKMEKVRVPEQDPDEFLKQWLSQRVHMLRAAMRKDVKDAGLPEAPDKQYIESCQYHHEETYIRKEGCPKCAKEAVESKVVGGSTT